MRRGRSTVSKKHPNPKHIPLTFGSLLRALIAPVAGASPAGLAPASTAVATVTEDNIPSAWKSRQETETTMTTFKSTRWALPLVLLAAALTAACGADTTTTESPANPAIEAPRIYPPTDVPEFRPDSTAADLLEGGLAQHEEKLHRAGGLPGMP